jgi:hypothetical protein
MDEQETDRSDHSAVGLCRPCDSLSRPPYVDVLIATLRQKVVADPTVTQASSLPNPFLSSRRLYSAYLLELKVLSAWLRYRSGIEFLKHIR